MIMIKITDIDNRVDNKFDTNNYNNDNDNNNINYNNNHNNNDDNHFFCNGKIVPKRNRKYTIHIK